MRREGREGRLIKRTVRLSQTVSPFGVGAIYNFHGESLIAADISKWGGAGERILLDRLAEDLAVKEFKSAPARWSRFGDPPGRLPFVRFPRWLFCPKCRKMTQWRNSLEVADTPAHCGICEKSPQLVPMRFVVACRGGHLGDVRWDGWAHSGATHAKQKQCRSKNLRFATRRGAGTGLGALEVKCSDCKASRSLEGITEASSHPAIRCSGKQPWEFKDQPPECSNTPVVLQRGASNLYFAEVRSAIDIPPDSDFDVYSDLTALVTNTPQFEILKSVDDELTTDLMIGQIADEVEVEERQVREIVEAAVAEIEGRSVTVTRLTGDLRRDEWNALIAERSGQDDRNRFITQHEKLLDGETHALPTAHDLLAERFRDPVLVTRLREVRALKGFRRYETDGDEISPSLDLGLGWLPAIEVFGEGIFLSLEEDPLREWEQRKEVVARVARLEERRGESLIGNRVKVASPRFVLLHTMAHLLIRSLAFECGYPAASLRERIYSAEAGGDSESFAGFLIYTAAGDSEGTLGGLVRQGKPPRMIETIMTMLEEAAWCASDPICIESGGQGFQALNRGACHACALVAETSCEFSNALLDRGLVIGPDTGFLVDVVDSALDEVGSSPREEE